jgi:hypothetical protein
MSLDLVISTQNPAHAMTENFRGLLALLLCCGTSGAILLVMRTPEAIRQEMAQLKALRPDHCRTTQDWIALQRYQELYAEWFESLSNQDE